MGSRSATPTREPRYFTLSSVLGGNADRLDENMASVPTLPPRRQRANSQASHRARRQSTLDVLLQMGFSQTRAEKAIAATGDRGVQLASDWLISHVNDPCLDHNVARDYVLYMCPMGSFQGELADFWEKSLSICGWNGAQAYFPHITLCPFFKADDCLVSYVVEIFTQMEELLQKAPGDLKLEFYSAPNFIGLFVSDKYYKFLENFTSVFASKLKKAGISIEAHKKQLHMTLAYQYPQEKHDQLLKMAKEINLGSDVRWDIRLYSRDPRTGHSEVRRVLQMYTPQEPDELELTDGDYVLVDPKEVTSSKDGWYSGISWVTGNVGMFPGVLTARTAETWTWVLHRSLPVMQPDRSVENATNANHNNLLVNLDEDIDSLYAKVDKKPKNDAPSPVPTASRPRRLYVVRHGERVDNVIGRDWVDQCFDNQGNYVRKDINMPRTVPKRGNHLDFVRDTPLTEVGMLQARCTGEALKLAGISFTGIYSSPSLRCVQTAVNILKGLGEPGLQINLEYGIFEWLGWYQLGFPFWMTPQAFSEQGYPINLSYKHYINVDMLWKHSDESVEQYYNRCSNVTRYIIQKHNTGGNILIVAHAGSLDACTRQLTGKTPRTRSGFQELVQRIPYCGVCACEEVSSSKKWQLMEPPIASFTNGTNRKGDWKVMMS